MIDVLKDITALDKIDKMYEVGYMGMHMRGDTSTMDKFTDYSSSQSDVVLALQEYF